MPTKHAAGAASSHHRQAIETRAGRHRFHADTNYMSMQSGVEQAVAYLQQRFPAPPDVAIVLGSGLGGFADALQDPITVPSSEIPNYPRSTVEGHKGELVFGILGGRRVLAVRGRVHFYESGHTDTVLFPVRVIAGLGARRLVITNAAGGINRTFSAGDLMVISDQLNMTGMGLPAGSTDIPRVADYYDPQLRRLALDTAGDLGIRVVTGSYAGVKGPSYETAAEVEMIHRLGGAAVGMSTVLETAMAVALGMKVLGISCITNKATGTSAAKLDHAEVTEVANRVKENFALLLRETITRIPLS
jgi:purine-nucleoside phosphorylase